MLRYNVGKLVSLYAEVRFFPRRKEEEKLQQFFSEKQKHDEIM